MKQAVILAGGLATRMYPRTLTVPKMLLPVAGRPFADWQLGRLAACGYTDVVLCIAHLGEPIRDHVGDGSRFGLRVRYSDEGKNLLGTAGALRHALDLLAPTFLVTYGDSYLPFDYADPLRILDAHDDCDAVMSVFRNRGAFDASNVKTDGEWVLAYEKGTTHPDFDCIDYGAIAIRRDTLRAIGEGTRADLAQLQADWARGRRLRACMARERFFEIGSPQGLADLEEHLSL